MKSKALATQSYNVSVSWRDYYALCKPNVVIVMLMTSLIGMLLAEDYLSDLSIIFWGNLGIGLSAASAAAINHIVDREIDQKMSRTKKRPVATGRVPIHRAIIFAFLLGIIGQSVLFVFVNSLTAWLTLASLVGYALIYTLFLKRATPQNIVIGGIAGAAPPLLGWVAVTGSIHPDALLLVLIIFAWTPPHFWALAVYKKDDYAKAGVPMLPVTHGIQYTKLHIVLYSFILLAVTLLPFCTGMFSWIYLFSATTLGVMFIYKSVRTYFSSDINLALNTFKFSITYLLLLFAAMLFDHFML
ncbi:heme o synthase [Sessilibacter corallicola]|uniref:Protoheme IX farnesyltransferase n=1 Tax=Sessilibacter corallicola TaxID=2904075 RepID=A0ABQ0ABC3_9GAMM|nr:heme o synthase [Sessilibacter corallicola]MCE2028064.1 heme o synthase [Sessilibacter corallicola]